MVTQELIRKFHETTDGEALDRIVRKLARCAEGDRPAVIEAFLAYMREGRLQHWREFIVPRAIELIDPGLARYAAAFEQGLSDPVTAYWCVQGLVHCLGEGCYGPLVGFALDAGGDTAARAHAIQRLGELSRQTFARGLPSDPGHWPLDRLPLTELERWRSEGFPEGQGFQTPRVSPCLNEPRTAIDKLAARLEKKLARYREKDQDAASPTNWLVPAEPDALKAVLERWALPECYVEFLKKFSPLKVALRARGYAPWLRLYGAAELAEGQHGYSENPTTGEALAEWNPEHVVIASAGGDPYVLNLGAVSKGDCPVLSAAHGQGCWEFEEVSPSFAKFLRWLG